MASEQTAVKLCTGLDCNKPSKLSCPTCIKIGVKDSYFCSQECFKANWTTHKFIHKKGPDGTFDPFPASVYTGKLRASYPLSATRKLPEHIQRPDYSEDGFPISEDRVKGSSKIEVLR
ncbi:Methionine aminopeptidase 1 [Entomophthora muscae]|uniref:Methionine aminopeptidase 1 n=1 Tax=Entomophthora muscae TaxID=34485 RepID=A0ACC2UJ10_9FUNG|nr:Methionine aminopeptidase 1 [Entomophthora muscae]